MERLPSLIACPEVEVCWTEAHIFDGSKMFKAQKNILQMFDINRAVHDDQPQFFGPRNRPAAPLAETAAEASKVCCVMGIRRIRRRFPRAIKQHIVGVVE